MRKIAAVLLIFVVSLCFSSCDVFNSNNPDHTHTPSEWIIDREVTLEEEGKKHKECVGCKELLESESIPVSTYGSEGLEYEFNERKDGYVVTSIGTCKDKDIVIPEIYNGLPVTNIGEHAFDRCVNMETVRIPNTVKTIEKYAFYFCTNLKALDLPESVITIEEATFCGCVKIKEVNLSKNVREFWTTAFEVCNSLERINVDKDNPYLKSIDGNLYTKDGKWFIQYTHGKKEERFVVPDSVEKISEGAFAFNCDYTEDIKKEDMPTLKEIVLPNSVTVIGNEAFLGLASLERINIPSSVTTIGAYAFTGCKLLSSISLPKSVTEIGYSAFTYCDSLKFNEYCDVCYLGNEENPYFALIYPMFMYSYEFEINPQTNIIATAAFAECSYLTDINIPDSVTVIGHSAFAYCFSLENLTIGKNVKTIGPYAFDSCVSLTEVFIPKSVKNIGEYAFNGCDAVQFYCEVYSQPSGWNVYWNPSFSRPVWGYTKEE